MAGGIPGNWNIGGRVSPQQAASNYAASAATKGQKWATNTLMPRRDPFQAAIDAAPTWLANLNAAGTPAYISGLQRVNKADVAQMIATVGPSLYTAGIQNKGAKRYAASAAQLIPAVQQIAANLPPRGGDAQNEQRMILNRRALINIRGLYRSK